MEIEFGDPQAPSRFETSWDLPPERCRAAILREKHWKYVHFAGGVPPMLFNLAEDPHETTNLAQRPEHADQISADCAPLCSTGGCTAPTGRGDKDHHQCSRSPSCLPKRLFPHRSWGNPIF